MLKNKLLIIGYTFPEPATTAAGVRMMQLITIFQDQGYDITFASTAAETNYSEDLKAKGIAVKSILLNDDSFDEFITDLNPSVVLFDRFITEEQFGWRVTENCAKALRILDTEDLHFLRKAREVAFKNGKGIDLYSETAKRELASILRSDLSLIISEFEMQLLTETFLIPEGLLFYLPFFVNAVSKEGPTFEERQHFIAIGNLQHAPNADAVVFLKKELWPFIRKQLPTVELHIYGAYATKEISALHKDTEGFFIEGWTDDLSEVLQKARVCLAPLRFGAGLKGKLLDAAQCGTPSVTTEVGEEGMCGELSFGGLVGQTNNDLIDAAIQLYTDKDKWLEAQLAGFEMIEKRFQKAHFATSYMDRLEELRKNLVVHRQHHFIGQILQHQSLQSTKYLSKWIHEKNKK